jgi:hypothetical protein
VVKRNAVKLKRKNDVIKNLKVQMVKEQQKEFCPTACAFNGCPK